MSNDIVAVVMRAAGAALLHSIWQGTLIAAVVATALHALQRHSAQTRYVIACAGLAALIGAWALTALAVVRAQGSTGEAGSIVLLPPTVEPLMREAGAPPPAIQVFASREALDAAVAPRASWCQRLDLWSIRLVPFWLAGVVLFAVRLLVSSVNLARLRRRPVVAVPAAIERRARDLAARLDIRRVVRVVESANVAVPVVVGWLKPVVMLPASTIAGLSPAQLESILAHELAHVRRHDVFVNAVQTVIEVVLFYHPAGWWISARIRAEREHCCDDVAVAICGDGVVYASALADLESNRSATPLAVSAVDGALYRRVRRVLAMPDASEEHAGKALPAVMLAAVALVLAAGTLTGRAAGPDGQTTVPTPGRSIPADQSVLQGRVVAVGSGRPVVGARVQAMSLNGTFEGATDADGRYEIAPMTPGSYTVAARADGFVDGYYGRHSGMAQDFGAQVIARGGQITAGIDLQVQRAGRVSGRILDPNGNGLAGVEIELVQPRRDPGDLSLRRAVAFAQTDEGGVYDLAGVAPGEYFVRAYIGRGGGTPDWFLDALARATGTPAAVFASTFYPGVTEEQTAQPVLVEAGQALPGVDFALATTRLLSVAGSVVDETGGSFEGFAVMLIPIGANGRDNAATSPVPIDPGGRFEVRDVLPGTYLVDLVRPSAKPGIPLAPPPPGALNRLTTPAEPLTVVDDVTDFELRVRPAARVAFSLMPDAGVRRTFEPGSVEFSVARRSGDGSAGFSVKTFGRLLGPNGAPLEMPTTSGPAFLRVQTPSGWMVKAMRLDGRDVEDGVVNLAPGRREVEVVLTDRVSGVSGVVVDRRGRPMPNYSVVVFPPEPARWHVISPAIRDQRTDNDGRFRIDGLPPGTYRAIAVPALGRGAIESAAVLERLQAASEEVRIGDGQQLAVSIQASALPDGLAP
jgi:beta-lactamase regulating signal transducer with metallopeptidase domain/protocatechuate 3,4-dioxygenase beta subunit